MARCVAAADACDIGLYGAIERSTASRVYRGGRQSLDDEQPTGRGRLRSPGRGTCSVEMEEPHILKPVRDMAVEVVPVLVSDADLIAQGEARILADSSTSIHSNYSHQSKPHPEVSVLYTNKLVPFSIPLPGSYLVHKFDDKDNLIKSVPPTDKDIMELHEQYIREVALLQFWAEAYRIHLPSAQLVADLGGVAGWADPDVTTALVQWLHEKKIAVEKATLVPLIRKYAEIGQEERAVDMVQLLSSVTLLEVMTKWCASKGLTRLLTRFQDALNEQILREESYSKAHVSIQLDSQTQPEGSQTQSTQPGTQHMEMSQNKRKANSLTPADCENLLQVKTIRPNKKGRLAKQLAATGQL
eukprot:Platyproteum_vivax@DN6085_c0_g1_i2.p1